jgi:hypothetical protein
MTASPGEIAVLRVVAARLGPLREEVVFVGGVVRSLLITDPAAPAARPTDDIDLIAAAGSRAEYYALAARLHALGFREDRRPGAPVCRWVVDGLTVDVMPDREQILGFSNRWYSSAREQAAWHVIGSAADDRIRVIGAPHFVATKLDSFRGRAAGDFYHHDMEDLVAVVDGREELLDELASSSEALRSFVGEEIAALLREAAFVEALPGHLAGDRASQARLPIVEQRLRAIAALRR